jgi:hypothetical protein
MPRSVRTHIVAAVIAAFVGGSIVGLGAGMAVTIEPKAPAEWTETPVKVCLLTEDSWPTDCTTGELLRYDAKTDRLYKP